MKQFYYLFSIALCALFLSNTAWAQVDVKGQVKDDGGDPLAGVNIFLKVQILEALPIPKVCSILQHLIKIATLVFSFIGFETVELSLNGKSNIVVENEIYNH